MNTFKVDINNVHLDEMRTEEDMRAEAKRRVPNALKEIGENLGSIAWKETTRAFQGSIIKMQTQNRMAYIRESGRNYQRTADMNLRRNIENLIFDEIKKMVDVFLSEQPKS